MKKKNNRNNFIIRKYVLSKEEVEKLDLLIKNIR